MQDIDMSMPGTELFPEYQNNYSSQDVNTGHDVGDPLTGDTQPHAADDGKLSDQQQNFRALREEISKMQGEREYWKGQAEAYQKIPNRQPEPTQEDALSALDFDDSQDIKKAFNAIRQENSQLRQEIKDAFVAVETKTQRQDWNSMVTQHVPKLTSSNPLFAEMINKVSNPYEAAYLLAQLNAKATAPQAPQPDYSAGNRALQNAQKPQTLASVGGQGQLSAADYYASMSDKDFMEIAAKNLANI